MHPDAQENILGKKWGAVGLVQDYLPNLFAMADIASKQANVVVEEVRGTCPQHITMMAIFGDTASVRAALDSIEAMAK
jgi:microcompartment protein CcmL/EutN